MMITNVICQSCGKSFTGWSTRLFCDECARTRNIERVKRRKESMCPNQNPVMTKQELITIVAFKNDVPKSQVECVLNSALQTISDELSKGRKIQLVGFGTFEAKERAQHRVLNPRTGSEMIVPPHKIPTFRAGKSLKEAMNR